jgi:flagellar biosynthesis protein FliR
MSSFDEALLAEVATFGLELTRVTGLVVVSPIPWESAPKRAKAAIVILLSVLAHQGPVPVAAAFTGPLGALLSVSSEFMAGAGMGFIVRLSVAAAEIAGGLIAPVIGFGAAQVFDPGTGETDSVLTRMLRLLAMLLFVTVGVHRVAIGALMHSFGSVPVGSIIHPEASAGVMLDVSAEILATGVRIALPVVAILTMTQIALAFVSRAAPTIQIFSVGFAVLLVVGGGILVLTLPDMAQELMLDAAQVEPRIEELMMQMAGL